MNKRGDTNAIKFSWCTAWVRNTHHPKDLDVTPLILHFVTCLCHSEVVHSQRRNWIAPLLPTDVLSWILWTEPNEAGRAGRFWCSSPPHPSLLPMPMPTAYQPTVMRMNYRGELSGRQWDIISSSPPLFSPLDTGAYRLPTANAYRLPTDKKRVQEDGGAREEAAITAAKEAG